MTMDSIVNICLYIYIHVYLCEHDHGYVRNVNLSIYMNIPMHEYTSEYAHVDINI